MVPGRLNEQRAGNEALPGSSAPVPAPLSLEAEFRHRRAQKTRAVMIWLGYLALSLFLVPVIKWASLPHVPATHQMLAFLLLFVCTLPVVLHLTGGGAGLPVFQTICLVYAISYALPIFFAKPVIVAMASRTGLATLSESAVTQALSYSLVGVLSLQAGFWFFKFSMLHLLVPRIQMPLNKDGAQRLLSFLGAFGLLLQWLGITNRLIIPTSFFYISVLISKQAAMCIALLYYYWLKGELSPRLRIWFCVMVGTYGVFGLAMGNFRTVLDPFVAIGAVYWMVRRQFPWRFSAIVIVIFLILQPIKAAYRVRVWQEGFASQSVSQRLILWGQLLQMSLSGEHIRGTAAKDVTTRMAISRTDLIHLFARVVELTPKQVPFQLGKTYEYLLYALIPRALWAGKPEGQAVNKFFGVAYDFQTKESVEDTSIGAPHLAEAYLNFGIFGVLFVMMIIGMIYGAVDRLFNHSLAGEGAIAVYAVILTDLWTIETATAPTFGGLIQSILVYTLVLWVVRKKDKDKTGILPSSGVLRAV